MDDQQPLVPSKLNGADHVYLQQARHTPEDNSGYEIRVHYKQTGDGDSSHSTMRNNSTATHKVSLSNNIQEVKPVFTSASQVKDPKRSLRIGGIADGAELEKQKDNKKKGMMLMSNEKSMLAMVDEEDERSKLPLRRARPLFYVAPNINEKSDEFIRSRKEAMRRSQSL